MLECGRRGVSHQQLLPPERRGCRTNSYLSLIRSLYSTIWVLPGIMNRIGVALTILVSGMVVGGLTGCVMYSDLPHAESRTYTVAAGDTMTSVSMKYNTSVAELQSLNNCSEPCVLRTGQVIRVPPSRGALVKELPRYPISAQRLADIRNSLAWPLPALRVVSPFGYRSGTFHEGVDFAAARGKNVYAAHDGAVVISGEAMRGYGIMVALQRDDMVSVYAHLDESLVARGQRVMRGDRIGRVGATGDASGPHLHFEIRLKNAEGAFQSVDPLKLLGR